VSDPSPHLAMDRDALRVLKKPVPVSVTFAASDGVCETLEGPVRYEAGDAILTGAQSERWPVQRGAFLASYAPVPPTLPKEDGLYRKTPAIALARRLTIALTVKVGWQNDPLDAHVGDWLLCYDDGSYGVLQDAIFRESYGPAPGETRWPPLG
jgi:hypothetical protein